MHAMVARTVAIAALLCACRAGRSGPAPLQTGVPVPESARASTARPSAQVDISGTAVFWRVHDDLRRGVEPSPALLDSMFRTPGYAALEQRERRRARLIHAFRLAFLPRLIAAPESLQAANPWVRSIVPHLRRAAERRRSIDSLLTRMSGDPMLARADSLARTLIVTQADRSARHPPVSFIVFARDGRGYPDLVIADALRILDLAQREKFFAHEFHHYYRHALSVPAPPRPPGFAAVVDILTNVEFEGVADRLDKAEIPLLSDSALIARYPEPEERAYYQRYRDEFQQGPMRVRSLDSALAGLPSDSASLAAASTALPQMLADGGRILGAYMAASVQEVFGSAVLARAAGDPRAFFDAYARAARECGSSCAQLSRESLRVIGRLYEGRRW